MMTKASKAEQRESERASAIVGELILTASALDNQLNQICISVLALDKSPMLEPVVASLDSSRKVEILKAYAGTVSSPQWKKALKDHAEAVEKVNRFRNTAAHSVLVFERGRGALFSPAAAKLLKSLDLVTRTTRKVHLADLKAATRTAQRALGSGANLLQNFENVAAERARRYGHKA